MMSPLRLLAMVALVASVGACGGSDGGALFNQGGAPATGGSGGARGGEGGGGAETGASGSGGIQTVTGGSTSLGTGGRPSTGGSPSTAGSAGGPPQPDGGTCSPGMKVCGGICVPYDPFVGCGAVTCTPCPDAKPNASPVCINDFCGYQCLPGHRLQGIDCVPTGALPDGGSAIEAGAGGSDNCPATPPTTGDICIALPYACTYGAVQCACLALAAIPFWFCQ